jgi:hypothetical protein
MGFAPKRLAQLAPEILNRAGSSYSSVKCSHDAKNNNRTDRYTQPDASERQADPEHQAEISWHPPLGRQHAREYKSSRDDYRNPQVQTPCGLPECWQIIAEAHSTRNTPAIHDR